MRKLNKYTLPPQDDPMAVVTDMIGRLRADPKMAGTLYIPIAADSGAMGLMTIPPAGRESLEAKLPDAKGKEVVIMTEAQARELGVIDASVKLQ